MPQLDPAWFPAQFFWLAVSFLFLYLGVRAVLPRLDKIFDERKKTVDENVKTAAKLRDEARKILKSYEDGIAEAKEKAATVLGSAKTEIAQQMADKEKEFALKTEKIVAENNRRLEAVRTEALGSISKIAADMAASIYTKVTSRDILKDKIARTVDEVLQERQGQ